MSEGGRSENKFALRIFWVIAFPPSPSSLPSKNSSYLHEISASSWFYYKEKKSRWLLITKHLPPSSALRLLCIQGAGTVL